MGLLGGGSEQSQLKLYITLMLICIVILLIFSSFMEVDEKRLVITFRIILWAAVGIAAVFTLLAHLSDW
jgi:uncharacterized membrane protein YbhN (UPF0104 family)